MRKESKEREKKKKRIEREKKQEKKGKKKKRKRQKLIHTDRETDGQTDGHKSFIDMRYNTEQYSKSNSIEKNRVKSNQIDLE